MTTESEGLHAPPGWRLVPVEPTREMCHAVTRAGHWYGNGVSKDIWFAMLAAAPSAPTVEPARLVPEGDPCTLLECPPGHFLFAGMLCFRSEYSTKAGQPDAYCCDSGEYFWGGTRDVEARSKLIVQPLTSVAVEPATDAPRAEREAVARIIDPAAWIIRDTALENEDRLKGHPNRWSMTGQSQAMASIDKLVQSSLNKADAILAALTPPAAGAAGEVSIEAIRQQVINTPETADFMVGVPLEAAHQRERWGVDHDVGKAPEDWLFLVGYLAGKACAAARIGDVEKARHHTISTAAALANWHAALTGADTRMRPGIDPRAVLGSGGEGQ